ncbi:hypothetical protein CGZ80_12960 [Rhodopirellula sp. MGV]|nr:hypothetical protein CGZ80_12960 [Rhodopirellula sp. MGV]PNY38169.1 hypothetical protein C2E31_03990 [Rhodopirellula baltica]
MVVIASIFAVVLVGGVVLFKGNVTGVEFAPSHFQTREFSFYEIPLLHVQISPIRRSVVQDPVSKQLLADSLISFPRGQKPKQWHLVWIRRGPTMTPAIASLLIQSLSVFDRGGVAFWVDWNKSHPQRAAVLWPQIQKLATRELYVLVPPLLELARTLPGDDDAPSLTLAVDEFMVQQNADLVKDLRLANRDRLADEVLQDALADYPDAETLQSMKLTRPE